MKIEMKIKSLSFLAIYFFLCTKLFGQIPSLGSFYIIEKNSKENNTQLNLEDDNIFLDTTLLNYLTAKKSTFYYNDSIIVNVTSSPFVEEFYTYTFKKNGNIILINRKSKTVVNTNDREYKESIDVFGLMNLDTFDYDTTSLQFLGENCKKISLKDNETNDYYKYITGKISYFSEAYKKRVYIPIQEYSKMLGFETSRRISDIKSDFDSEIFDLDTIGYQKIDIKSWVTNIIGFEVVPDSVYYSKDNIKKYNSIDLNTRDNLNVADTFFTVTNIIRNLTDRCRKCSINNLLDSIKINKSIEKGLLLQIQKQYKENSLESIVLEFYLSKNLSTKEGRFLLLKNLDFAKIKLHNNESPLSLKEFIDKGYDLSSVISQMKGYNLLEVKLSNLKLKSIFRQLIVIAFPELIKESIKIKERKNAFEIHLGNWNYLVYKPSSIVPPNFKTSC